MGRMLGACVLASERRGLFPNKRWLGAHLVHLGRVWLGWLPAAPVSRSDSGHCVRRVELKTQARTQPFQMQNLQNGTDVVLLLLLFSFLLKNTAM